MACLYLHGLGFRPFWTVLAPSKAQLAALRGDISALVSEAPLAR